MDYEKMRKHWDRATSYERTFLAMHPFLVKDIEENARKATDETVRRFGRNGYNDSSDAFRHCYFSALLRSEEHTSELQSRPHLVCRLLLEKKKKTYRTIQH